MKMVLEEVYDVFGLALKHQLESKDPIYHHIERDDGYLEANRTDNYFSLPSSWPSQELEILKHAKSPILDIGCGAARHSLFLQDQGLDVVALDVSEGALFVTKQRGVKRTILGSAHKLPSFEDPFASYLLLCNNFGICGSPAGTMQMLETLHRLSTQDAKILLSYRSPIPTENPFHLAYHKRNQVMGLPIGQVSIRIRYLKYKSAWFGLYLPTPEEFRGVIQRTGWKIAIDLLDTPTIHYVILEKTV